MTPGSDAEITAPKDPAEYRPRALLGVSFWATVALCVLCVLAGIGVAVLAPRLWAHRPAPRVEAPLPAEPPRPAAELPPPSNAPVVAAAPEAAPPVAVAELSARVASLEAQQVRTSHAAAAALAAAALVEASQGSGPFPEEAASLRAIAPGAPELGELTRLAATGAPARAELAASFPDYAARAASAARLPGEGASIRDRLAYALSRVVMVRRVGEVAGEGADAQIARAERAVEDGDLDRAFTALDKLPPAAREAMAPWRVRAERRAEIDRYAAALRARALADLAAAGRGGA
ncbi:MAG: hypothetical protein E7812_19270 [Phenylobacterium sp.]|nr:MAG: hypothetical protein E7812_19270 [Phenylobacterium sp.]